MLEILCNIENQKCFFGIKKGDFRIQSKWDSKPYRIIASPHLKDLHYNLNGNNLYCGGMRFVYMSGIGN